MAVEADAGASVADLKRSLCAMTRVPVARQALAWEGSGVTEPLLDEDTAPSGKRKGFRVVLRERAPPKKPAAALDAHGGGALAAFLADGGAPTPPEAPEKPEDPEPAHLRTTGTGAAWQQ